MESVIDLRFQVGNEENIVVTHLPKVQGMLSKGE